MVPHAIETHYNGYRFRSRLEARWAVFFDSLGVRYEYEREGFTLPTAPYLPDFFLPLVRNGLWCEIKPSPCEEPDRAEALMRELTALTQKDGVVLYGDPVDVMNGLEDSTPNQSWIKFADGGSDGPFYFCLCPWCGKIGFEFDGRGARVCGFKAHHASGDEALAAITHLGHWHEDKCYTGNHHRIVTAATTARSARF